MTATDAAATTQAWSRVEAEAARLAHVPLADLFSAGEARVRALTLEAPHLTADFSKQRIDAPALHALEQLAEAAGFAHQRDALFTGGIVNATEGRPAKHWALRGDDAPAEVKDTRAKMAAFAKRIRPDIDAIVHLGIGGSDLGPRLVMDALKPLRIKGLEVRFAANVDGADAADAIEGLDPARTLLIVVSKTFTTQETLANAEFVRAWGPAYLAAATAAPEKAIAWGVPAENVFAFWDWVGGRYSVWGPIGLALMIAIGAGRFGEFLSGARAMDEHFLSAPFAANMPVA
ncbi:MAG TPA: glucose-6-phosphate isomerase, partial [Terricaulis sp.]|nr:glucose-6-phosphate isomerase [Terricaulis sp.]